MLKVQGKKHKPKNTQIKFVYFSEVCVVFSRTRIAFAENVEVKHTIYFDWPKGEMSKQDFFYGPIFTKFGMEVCHSDITYSIMLE